MIEQPVLVRGSVRLRSGCHAQVSQTHQLREYDRPKAREIVGRQSAQKYAYAQIDFAQHNRRRNVLEDVHQLLLY